MVTIKTAASMLLAGLTLAVPATSNVITSDPGWTAYPMLAAEYIGDGPQTFGSQIAVTWTSTNAFDESWFGWSMGGYGFGANGTWDSALTFAGLNDNTYIWGSTDTMTFSFSTPVSGVAGFINYSPGFSTPTTIAVYNGSNLIESYNLTFSTGGGVDTGMWLGFQESTPITSFTLTDNYIAITDFELQASTPEPASLILLGSTLLGGLALRRLFES